MAERQNGWARMVRRGTEAPGVSVRSVAACRDDAVGHHERLARHVRPEKLGCVVPIQDRWLPREEIGIVSREFVPTPRASARHSNHFVTNDSRNLMKAIAGDRLVLFSKPVVLPRTAPMRVPKNLRQTSQIPTTTQSSHVVTRQSRPTTFGHYVRGFLGCQAVSPLIFVF